MINEKWKMGLAHEKQGKIPWQARNGISPIVSWGRAGVGRVT